MALADVVDLLACPHCQQQLGVVDGDRLVRCPLGHSFDVARQGYVNLGGRAGPGNADTPAMLAARDRFLSAGHFRPLADRLLELVGPAGADPRLLEVGAGTGYYLARLLSGLTRARGVALDVSVAAARRSARAHPRLGSVIADAWRPLPVTTGSIDILLNVFAPRNAGEFARVLSSSGRLLTVTPEAEHLAELRDTLGLLGIRPGKQSQLESMLGDLFTSVSRESLRYGIELTGSALGDLVAMGPNAFHLSEAEISARVRSVDPPRPVSVAVSLEVWAVR